MHVEVVAAQLQAVAVKLLHVTRDPVADVESTACWLAFSSTNIVVAVMLVAIAAVLPLALATAVVVA